MDSRWLFLTLAFPPCAAGLRQAVAFLKSVVSLSGILDCSEG
jgi:hypothetical protein